MPVLDLNDGSSHIKSTQDVFKIHSDSFLRIHPEQQGKHSVGYRGLVFNVEKCLKFFYPKNNVKVLNVKVNRDNINEIIFSNIKQRQIDFLSIDIDGIDYWVLEKIDTDKINVICSEYNPWIGNNVQKVISYNYIYKR